MSTKMQRVWAVGLTWPVAIAAAVAWCGLCCYSSAGRVADARDDGSDVTDVETPADAGDDGDSGSGPDVDAGPDVEHQDHGDAAAGEIPRDGGLDVPDAWDVTPYVPEPLDCTGRNECYVELPDGGVGCELPDHVDPWISCEVEFKVRQFDRPGVDWFDSAHPLGEPFAGRTLARDGTEAIVVARWYDSLSYSMEGWHAQCRGHCAYDWFLSLSDGHYLIHVPTGVVLAATARPAVSYRYPEFPPDCEIDGVTPEGEPMGWCWRDSPEFDVRYLWRAEGVELPFIYEGSVIPAALHRRRLSTGEELPPIDLPLLPP
jgi:hypothetical protein